MACINDFVTDVSPGEREALEAALRTGESIRWATRPLRGRGLSDALAQVAIVLAALLFLWVPLVILLATLPDILASPPSCLLMQDVLLCLLLLLFFVLPGALLAVFPWLRWHRRCHTLCVLTNHRALVLAAGYFIGWSLQAYPLHEKMLYARLCRPGGSGDLLFLPGTNRGFTWLPNLAEAHRELNAAVNALLDAAEPQSRHLF